ncbi:MAG: hypothetical protein RLZZ436_2084, partial [Planctomycetota bacterium]
VETVGSRWPGCPRLSGRAEAPGCDFAPWCAPLPAASASRNQGTLPAGCRQAAHGFGVAFTMIMSGRAEAPGCDFAPWCAPLPAASASRCQGTLPAGCRQAAHGWRKPPVAIRTLVRTPARGVSSALPGHFTRGLPPCGSWVLTSHFRLSSRGRDPAQQELRPPGNASCQKARAIGCQSRVTVRARATNTVSGTHRPIDIGRSPHCVFVARSGRGISPGRLN